MADLWLKLFLTAFLCCINHWTLAVTALTAFLHYIFIVTRLFFQVNYNVEKQLVLLTTTKSSQKQLVTAFYSCFTL